MEFVTADHENAEETLLYAISSPNKGMGRFPIGFWKKSNFFSLIRSQKGAEIANFFNGAL